MVRQCQKVLINCLKVSFTTTAGKIQTEKNNNKRKNSDKKEKVRNEKPLFFGDRTQRELVNVKYCHRDDQTIKLKDPCNKYIYTQLINERGDDGIRNITSRVSPYMRKLIIT